MGRGECVISKRDLDVLDKLYSSPTGYRVSNLARSLGIQSQTINDNLKRLKHYGLVYAYPKKEEVGVGAYYALTEAGRQVYSGLAEYKKERRRTLGDSTAKISSLKILRKYLAKEFLDRRVNTLSIIAEKCEVAPEDVKEILSKLNKSKAFRGEVVIIEETGYVGLREDIQNFLTRLQKESSLDGVEKTIDI